MGPRVLVVGGHVAENQFVRQVRNAGCDVIWHNGNAGKSFPHFCDALVCAKYQLSHEGYWQAKAAYKGKPMFVADHSWSTIKERFEIFVDDWNEKNKSKQTVLGAAMQKAIQHTNGSAAGTTAQYANPPTKPHHSAGPKIRYTQAQKTYLVNFVRDARYKNMSYQEIVDELTRMGKKRSDGEPFKVADITYWVKKMPGYKTTPRAEIAAVAFEPKPVPHEHPPTKAEPRSTDKLVYELILSANLPPQETTALMRKCMDGKLTQNEALKFIELYTDLRGS